MCEPSVQGLSKQEVFWKVCTHKPSFCHTFYMYFPILSSHPTPSLSHSPSSHSPPHTLLTPSSSHPPSSHTLLFTPSSSHPPLHTLPPHMHPLFSHPNTRHTALQKFVICPLASQQGQRHYTSSSKVHHFSMSCDVM